MLQKWKITHWKKPCFFLIFTMERFVITNHFLQSCSKVQLTSKKCILKLVFTNHSFYHIFFTETTEYYCLSKTIVECFFFSFSDWYVLSHIQFETCKLWYNTNSNMTITTKTHAVLQILIFYTNCELCTEK